MADADVIVVGAGVAGLAAARELKRAGFTTLVVEGRNRIGGRIYTQREPGLPVAIELGAEFIHGRPREVCDLLREEGLRPSEVPGTRWCSIGGRLEPCNDWWDKVESIFETMDDKGPDRTFAEHLASVDADDERKFRATAFVEGFNAARADRISVHSLVQANKASEEIEGSHSYRLLDGYDWVVRALARDLDIRTGAKATRVRWRSGAVTVETIAGDFRASRAVLTLPLGVLQAGAVAFEPELYGKREAANLLAVGEVVRVTFRFRERFWEARTPGLSYLHSDDLTMATWWSAAPSDAPVLTGWAAAKQGRALSGLTRDQIAERALDALARILALDPRPFVDTWHTHDWQSDPLSRGAYSYIPVGALECPRRLAAAVEDTLFFAGEATNTEGHGATVHGAIATGMRAAREAVAALRRTN
jgi:monoamine oxidase